MSQLQCDQDVAGSGSGNAFWPQLPVFKDKGTLTCLTGTHCVFNPWLTPLIPSPPTHSHCRKDAFSLLGFPAPILNASWCSKLVKNPNPWKCNALWGKRDGSGSAGTNIPGVPFISRTLSIYLDFFPLRVAQRTKTTLPLLASMLTGSCLLSWWSQLDL